MRYIALLNVALRDIRHRLMLRVRQNNCLKAKKREPIGSLLLNPPTDYMFAIIASPNSEHFSSLAPSIERSKS